MDNLLNRLYRSRETRIIAGVAGGLAEYFQVDVVLIRILWLIAVFVGGGGILAYIIAWIVIPEEGEQKGEAVVFHGEGTCGGNRSEWKRRTPVCCSSAWESSFWPARLPVHFFTISGPC